VHFKKKCVALLIPYKIIEMSRALNRAIQTTAQVLTISDNVKKNESV